MELENLMDANRPILLKNEPNYQAKQMLMNKCAYLGVKNSTSTVKVFREIVYLVNLIVPQTDKQSQHKYRVPIAIDSKHEKLTIHLSRTNRVCCGQILLRVE